MSDWSPAVAMAVWSSGMGSHMARGSRSHIGDIKWRQGWIMASNRQAFRRKFFIYSIRLCKGIGESVM